MQQDTIRQLSAIAPPPRSNSKPWRFKDNRTAWLEVARLESEIGLPHGPKIIAIGAANARVEELETILQKIKASTPPPVVSQPAAPQLPVLHAGASAATPPAAQVPPAAKSVPESARGHLARLACQRDRIAGALHSLKGIDLACGRQKIADLDAKIEKLSTK